MRHYKSQRSLSRLDKSPQGHAIDNSGETAKPHHDNPLIACSEGLDRPDEDKEPLQRTSSSLQRSGHLECI